MRYVLERSQVIPRPREEVFSFFADVQNLQAITPAFLGLHIFTERPIAMREGAILEYRLRLYGLPQKWRTRIVDWSPPERFADLQEAGPYRYWLHTHSFVELASGATLMGDRVEYELPFGIFGRLVHALLVKRALRRIFDYRRERIAALMGAEASV